MEISEVSPAGIVQCHSFKNGGGVQGGGGRGGHIFQHEDEVFFCSLDKNKDMRDVLGTAKSIEKMKEVSQTLKERIQVGLYG